MPSRGGRAESSIIRLLCGCIQGQDLRTSQRDDYLVQLRRLFAEQYFHILQTAKMRTQENIIPLGNALIVWNTLLLLCSSCFVAVRTWAKWQHHWSLADGVFVAGYVYTSKEMLFENKADIPLRRSPRWHSAPWSTWQWYHIT